MFDFSFLVTRPHHTHHRHPLLSVWKGWPLTLSSDLGWERHTGVLSGHCDERFLDHQCVYQFYMFLTVRSVWLRVSVYICIFELPDWEDLWRNNVAVRKKGRYDSPAQLQLCVFVLKPKKGREWLLADCPLCLASSTSRHIWCTDKTSSLATKQFLKCQSICGWWRERGREGLSVTTTINLQEN